MNIHQIVFSPTGGTQRVSEILCKSMREHIYFTDLCVKANSVQQPQISQSDLVLIAMPVFVGRVPALAVERLKGIKSSGAKCVVVAVYGNRAYDDALLEMQDVATVMGFQVIAAIGAVAEHSIIRKYGKGRPDANDVQTLQRFAADIMRKVAEGNNSMPKVPGNRPYKQGGKVPQPKAGRKCTGCGICAKYCPADAISTANPKAVDTQKCISCMKCISVCPKGARTIGKEMTFLTTQKLKDVCSTRKENELYL